MNNTVLLVEDNLDDQFLIKRALNKRLLNKTNLVGLWSKSVDKTVECSSSRLNNVDLSYPSIPTVDQYTELIVSVEVVNNKEEAVHYLKGKKSYANRERYPLPVLILIDVAMPHLPGLCLLSWIKRQPALIHIPVIVISDVDKQEQAMNLGAIAYIGKTLCFTDLTEVVRAFLLSAYLHSQEQSQSQNRRSEQLKTLASPTMSREQSSNRGVIKAASWRRIGQKVGQSSLEVPL
jgi:CheY-like chemotaxis protein